MTPEALKEVLQQHALWLEDKSKGKRADLSGANLYGAYLTGANLYGANLSSVDITGTRLSEAQFNCTHGIRYAVLSFAGLGEASRQWLLVEQDGKPMFHIGCFIGDEDELLQKIESGPDEYKASRLDALDMLLRMYAYSKP